MSKANNAYTQYMKRDVNKNKGGVGLGDFEWLSRRVSELGTQLFLI
jgi:hypothetical protein